MLSTGGERRNSRSHYQYC